MPADLRSHLSSSLAAIFKRTDASLLHLTRVLSSSAGVDSTLCTLCYALTLLHSQLARVLSRRYEKLAQALVSKASLLPDETSIAGIPPPRSRLSETCAGVKALAELIGDFRIFVRLWGFLDVYKTGRETYTKPPRDPIIKTLVWAQLGAYATFQFLENGAYLASKGVLRGARWARREPKWCVASNRFWMAQVLLEMLRLLRVRQLKYNEDFGAEAAEDERKVKVESKELEGRWHRSFYANAGWFPLTLHWSFEDETRSPVNETSIGVCGMVPGIVGFLDAWERTQ